MAAWSEFEAKPQEMLFFFQEVSYLDTNIRSNAKNCQYQSTNINLEASYDCARITDDLSILSLTRLAEEGRSFAWNLIVKQR